MICLFGENTETDFAMYHIENYLITKDVYTASYDEEIEASEAKESALVKLALAVQFWNDLNRRHGIEPCYYLNGKPVSSANYERTRKGIECRYENNGWRLLTKDEVAVPIFSNFEDVIQCDSC